MQTIDTAVENFHLSRILSIWNGIYEILSALHDLKSGKNHISGHADENTEADIVDLIKHEPGHRRQSFPAGIQVGILPYARIGSLRTLTGIVSDPDG